MTELRVQRHLPAPPERVWRALTDPEALRVWFWPEHFGTVATTDPRPGGAFRISATATDLAVQGEYTIVEAPHRLAFTWRWDGDEAESLVTIELTRDGAGTTLVLTHQRLADEVARADHAAGWSDCLDRLPGYLDDDGGERSGHPPDEPSGQPPARSPRAPARPPDAKWPRLLGGPEDIEQAMRPRPERLDH